MWEEWLPSAALNSSRLVSYGFSGFNLDETEVTSAIFKQGLEFFLGSWSRRA